MLVDGDEVIHDSKRIIQYLEWKYRKDAPRPGRPGWRLGRHIQFEAMETPQEAIKLTDEAAGKIKDLLAANGNADEQALRVAVRGGGCSGFQYALALDQPKDEDHVFEHQGVAVVVDKVSMQFVFGSEVDYVDGLQGAGFVVNNPNVVAACGCGSSFQVREDAAEGAVGHASEPQTSS